MFYAQEYKTYYKKLGYDVPKKIDTKMEIHTKDLSKGSTIKIRCKCSNCGKIKNIMFKKYKKSIFNHNYYTCHGKCSGKKSKNTWSKKSTTEINNITKKRKQTCLKNHNVENILQSKKIKEKIKQTCLERYGVENISQLSDNSVKVKQTCLERYGNENYNNPNKNKQTCLKNYGVEFPLQSEEIRQKYKQTCLKKYGVEHPMQCEDIFLKTFKSSIQKSYYKDTNLHYQGTYEKDFLDNYINKINIDNGPTIKYNYENKNKVYFSDFFIKSKNLIIEIKSDYTYNLHLEKNLTKQKACVEQGYIFIFIINKDYSELNNTF